MASCAAPSILGTGFPEQLARLDEVSAIELGFPHDFLASETVQGFLTGQQPELIDNHRARGGAVGAPTPLDRG